MFCLLPYLRHLVLHLVKEIDDGLQLRLGVVHVALAVGDVLALLPPSKATRTRGKARRKEEGKKGQSSQHTNDQDKRSTRAVRTLVSESRLDTVLLMSLSCAVMVSKSG